jgi:probable phosphoglycerate mutase
MKLYLLRHGHQEVNQLFNIKMERPDPELSDQGRLQAKLLGQHLAKRHITALYTSDLKRAVQTAESVNRYLRLPLDRKPHLWEIEIGEVSIKGWDQVALEYPSFYPEFQQNRVDLVCPGAESGLNVQQRAMLVLEELVTLHPPKSNLAIMCHSGVIMVLLTAIQGLPQEQRFRFQINHCSISIVEYDTEDQSFRILSNNDTTHLEEDPKERR